jgi:hypothetical protein
VAHKIPINNKTAFLEVLELAKNGASLMLCWRPFLPKKIMEIKKFNF